MRISQVNAEAPDPLASQLRQRRLSLGLSISAAAEAVGVNRVTWSTWENATSRPQRYSYAGVERTLHWKPGSIDRIRNGQEPEPLDEPEQVLMDFTYKLSELPPDIAELVELYRQPSLTAGDREDLLVAVRMAVRGTYMNLLRRQDEARDRARKSGRRAG